MDYDNDELWHYGMPRRSGRYPWGSGENPYQHNADFLARVEFLKNKGMSEVEIAKTMSADQVAFLKKKGLTDEQIKKLPDIDKTMSTTQLRTRIALAKHERDLERIETAKSMKEKGYTNQQIADKLGYPNESTVRSVLNPHHESRLRGGQETADILKKRIDEVGMVDVGLGTEKQLGVSKERMNEALYILQMQGYEVYGGRQPQVTNRGQMTTLKVACPPGTKHSDIFNYENVHSVLGNYVSHDGGETFDPKYVYPKSMSSKRLKINYAEDGGAEKDGLIEIRRGVDDLSLGESRYAQVRILVDDTHFIKGMAVYSDNMPDGVDVVFNTNKKRGTPALGPKDNTVLKNIKKDDPDNPFGSLIKSGVDDPDNPMASKGGQSYYYDKNGKKQLSLINKRAEEGDWNDWANKVPSQFLSKQKESLIKRQLSLTIADANAEFDEICSLTNPTIKKKLLQSFADDCDSAAEHLKAAGFPNQRYQVILPMPSVKETEVYAPNYEPGTKVALIRYPHGGTFEIPILTVNNKSKEGRSMIGNTPADAVGINSKVAERLSGADFDGDTVMVIPLTDKVSVTSTPKLKGLEGFDPKLEYGHNEPGTFKVMRNTQNEMGKISNLITDMTLKGATPDELAAAVRHSMVVIDAEKHLLDYKRSEIDNNIAGLKKKYQTGGASTLISRAKSPTTIPERKPGVPGISPKTGKTVFITIDPETGKKLYRNTGREYVKVKAPDSKKWVNAIEKDGILYYKVADRQYERVPSDFKVKRELAMISSTRMQDTDDARTLISGMDNPKERIYADYANKRKALANEARKAYLNAGKQVYSPSAAKAYADEVKSLNAKLDVAIMNQPLERRAQAIANSRAEAKIKDNFVDDNDKKKKIRQQELTRARDEVGAKRNPIDITDREWEAIQAGAISENKLTQIINHTDIDMLRSKATPKAKSTALSRAKVSQIRAMEASGYTTNEIAKKLNLSTTTILKYLKDSNN